MGFTCTIPIANMATANAALEPTYGPENFRLPLRPPGGTGEAESVALHSIATDAAFQAACAALPGAVVTASAPLVNAFEAHVAAQSLEWTDPIYWYVSPIMTNDERLEGAITYRSKIDWNVWPVTNTMAWEVVSGIPAWEPFNGSNFYLAGAVVTHGGKVWVNPVWNGNTLEPGTPGSEQWWIEVVE